MSDTHTSVWRQALRDTQHPMNRAAWYLFRKNMSVRNASRRLETQKDDVIEFVKLLFRNRKLYEPGSLGGAVPYNCIELMAHWQVESFIPELIPALVYTEEHFFENDLDFVFDRIIQSLTHDYGSAVVEPLLQAIESGELTPELASHILSQTCVAKDDRCYRVIQQAFENADDPSEIESYAEDLLQVDIERGRMVIQKQLDADENSPETIKRLRRTLKAYS